MYRLADLANLVGGEVVGEADTAIFDVQPFDRATQRDLSLATKQSLLDQVEGCQAAAVIVPAGFQSARKPLLRAANPKLVFARALELFNVQPFQAGGVSPLASFGEDCQIPDEVSIGPFVALGDRVTIGSRVRLDSGVVIGSDCRLGDGCHLHPNVSLYSGVTLGNGVIVHAGTVIGADGFGYVFDGTSQVKVPQQGKVEIHDRVEIGANSCIDRGTFGATVIGRGVKIDNLVHIGHNCQVGENTVIVGCVGISGSVKIGKNCILAGQAGVSDHVNIGDGVTVMAKTAVTRDVSAGSVVSGPYGRDHGRQLKLEALIRKLPELYRQWRRLTKALKPHLSEDRKL